MHYSNNPASVRVDFFKESGKWYTTEDMIWLNYVESEIHAVFKESLVKLLTKQDGKLRYAGMIAICLEPYHEYSHPLMIRVPDNSTSW